MKHFLTLEQLGSHKIKFLCDINAEMKRIAFSRRKNAMHLLGKTVLCLTDTEYDFLPIQLACKYLGGDCITANVGSVADYIKKVNNYGVSLVAVKTKSQAVLDAVSNISVCPVINLGTETRSPVEALSYIFTLNFAFDVLEQKNIALLGNKNKSIAAELVAYLKQCKANVSAYFPFINSSFYPPDTVVYSKIEHAVTDAHCIIDLGIINKQDNELYYGSAKGLSERVMSLIKPEALLLGSSTYYTAQGEKEYPYNQSNRLQKDYLGAIMTVLYYFYRD